MRNKKYTAVELLFEQINDTLIDFTEGKISASIYGIRVTEYKQQALEIEKQQIINAWICDDNVLQRIAAEKYYKETYEI
jgi:hypothetical protein